MIFLSLNCLMPAGYEDLLLKFQLFLLMYQILTNTVLAIFVSRY
jgi:hypothetical protein